MSLDRHLRFLVWYKDPVRFFKDIYKLDPFPYQARILRDLTNYDIKRMHLMGAGGTGKTKLLGAIALYYVPVLAYFKGKMEVIIISGSEDQAKHLYNYTLEAIEDNPELGDLVDGEPRITLTKFKDRSVIRALARSMKKIQGKHGDLVIVDEAILVGDHFLKDTLRIVNDNEYSRIIFSGTPVPSYMVKGCLLYTSPSPRD